MREKVSNANTRIYFEVRATTLHPRLHTKGFQLSTIGSFTQGPLLRNYNSTQEYTTPSLYTTNLYTRGGHLAKDKAKEIKILKIGLRMIAQRITNTLLVISKDHKQFSHKTNILKIGLEMIDQV